MPSLTSAPVSSVRANPQPRRQLSIAIFVGHLPVSRGGGTERQALRAATELAARGHTVWVFARGRQPEPYRRDGVWIAERAELRASATPLARVPLLRMAHDVQGGLRGVFGSGQRFDIVLSYHTFDAGLVGTAASLATRSPHVLWIRSGEEYRLGGVLKRRLVAPGTWLRTERLLVQSPTLAREFERAVARILPDAFAARIRARVEVVPNGLDLPSTTEAPSGRELLVVGRLDRGKGVGDVIEALPTITGAHLTLVGDGEERSGLEALARGLPVTFAGSLPASALSKYYQRATVVVFPSRLDEGLPNVLLEAMASGRPTVATRVGGVVDAVQDRINGLLVEPGQPAQLSSAINHLLHSPDTLLRMGAAARRTAETYAWDRVLPQLETALINAGRLST
jgi:glycosyltransferase involved in cell wall biosynthesis